MAKRRTKGEPTDTNIFVLNDYIYGREAANAPGGVITKVPAVSVAHLRRLIDAGWLVPTPAVKGGFVISLKGREGLAEWRERQGLVVHPNGRRASWR